MSILHTDILRAYSSVVFFYNIYILFLILFIIFAIIILTNFNIKEATVMKRTVRNCLITCAVILLILLVLTVLEIRCFACLPHVSREGAAHWQGGKLHVCVNNFPDKAFRLFLRNNYCTNGRNALSRDQIDAITEMDCSGIGAKSLKGIEHFTSLEKLNCADNELEALSVKKLSKLSALNCSNNQLTDLSLYHNSCMKILNCSNNQLTGLGITNLKNLTSIDCSHNHLSHTFLFSDLGPSLNHLDCSYNSFDNIGLDRLGQLTDFNISPQNTTVSYREEYGYRPINAITKNRLVSAVTSDGTRLSVSADIQARYFLPKSYNDSVHLTINVKVGSRTVTMDVYEDMECSHQYPHRVFLPTYCIHCGDRIMIYGSWWVRLIRWVLPVSCVMALGAVIYLRRRKAKGKDWDVVMNVPDRETYVN